MPQVADMEVQASRVKSLMDDLSRIVPEVELQMGPLLKVRSVSRHRVANMLVYV